MTLGEGSRVKEPAMALSHLPVFVGSFFVQLSHWLDKRSAARVPVLLLGMLLASGRRTVTSWFRAADLWEDWSQGYLTAIWTKAGLFPAYLISASGSS